MVTYMVIFSSFRLDQKVKLIKKGRGSRENNNSVAVFFRDFGWWCLSSNPSKRLAVLLHQNVEIFIFCFGFPQNAPTTTKRRRQTANQHQQASPQNNPAINPTRTTTSLVPFQISVAPRKRRRRRRRSSRDSV